jgi:HEAT repeat protein
VVLAEIGNAQGEDVLIDALNDSDSSFTESLAEVLGKISTSETLAKLIQLPEIDIYDPDIFR